MKKLLSIALILALVISCLSSVHISAAQETVTGREFRWPTVNYVHGSNGGWAADELAEGTHMYNVTVYNTSAVDTKVNVYLQNGWGQMTKSVAFDTPAGNFRIIPAGGKTTIAVVVRVGADGTIGGVAQSAVCIRVDTDTANADKKVVVAYTDTEFDKLIKKATGAVTDVTDQSITVTETPIVEAAEWASLSGYGITVEKSGDIFTAKNFTGSWTAPDFNIFNQAKALLGDKTSYDIEVTYQVNPNKDITVRPIIRAAINSVYCFGKDVPTLSTAESAASSKAWMSWYKQQLGLADNAKTSIVVSDGQNASCVNSNTGVTLKAGEWTEIKMHITVRPEDFNIFKDMRVTFDNIRIADSSAISDLEVQLKAVNLAEYILAWSLNGTVLTISGKGKMHDYSADAPAPWGTNITKIIIEDGITNIGNYAFSSCSKLTSITIPENVTSIGEYAFSGCTGLTTITVPNSVTSIGKYAFYRCNGLTSITLPFIGGSTTSNTYLGYIFGASSYSDNPSYVPESLKTVTISDGCTSVPDHAFYDCRYLTEIVIPNSITHIGTDAFFNCPAHTHEFSYEEVVSSAYYENYKIYSCYCGEIALIEGKCGDDLAFSLNSSTGVLEISGAGEMWDSLYDAEESLWLYPSLIKKVIINEGVTSIGKLAFCDCFNLQSVSLPDSMKVISDDAFNSCYALASINIPAGVTEIGFYAFNDCSSLEEITVPDSVTTIENCTFQKCSKLKKVTLGNGVTSIGDWAFAYCDSLTSVEIPDSVTSIGDGAFVYCSSLTSIEIPDSVTSIGDGVFGACSSLTSIIIPDSVTSIGEYAFEYCINLTSITIPDGVTSIGDYAFSDCHSLTSIAIPNSVTRIGDDAFYGCTDLTIFCYPGSYAWNYATNNSIPVVPAGEITGISVSKLPTKTVYPINGNFIADGLTLTVSLADGSSAEMTGRFNVDVDLSTAGERTATVSLNGFTATFKVTVDPDLIEYPESEHNYANNTDQSWTIYKKGVSAISITFSGKTQTESGWDYIYIYDANGTQIGKYSGTELANKTITVDGDTVRIRLTSDDSYTYYGFAVTDITFVQPVITDILGDVNKDGKVTPKDRMILSRYLDGWDGYDALCDTAVADIDGDGSVTQNDRQLLARYLAGWSDHEQYFD